MKLSHAVHTEQPAGAAPEQSVAECRQWPARTSRRFASVLIGLLSAVVVVRTAIVVVMVVYGAAYGPTGLLK